MKRIEVILSPALFEYRTISADSVVVVIDVLRATTAFCAAFESGIEIIIPVSGLDELLEYKNNGFLTAAERDGNKVDFADFGNSPVVFLQSNLKGKRLAYSTTNGTQAVEVAKQYGNIAIASFANLQAVADWLTSRDKDVVLLCSGWKNSISFEDTLCAGALVEALELSGNLSSSCDASVAALILWKSSENKLAEMAKQGNHYQRLLKLGQLEDLRHCFLLNTSTAVPVWDGEGFRNLIAKV